MIYNNLEEAKKSKEKFITFLDGDIFNKHYKKYEFFESKYSPKVIGQFFLYEIYSNHEISYPKLGLYLNTLPCDQTIEVEFINLRRTWEWNTQYKYTYESKEYTNYIGELQTKVDSVILWGDSMLVYGLWDKKPNWKEMKKAYERTWWFWRSVDEKRNITLDNILKKPLI